MFSEEEEYGSKTNNAVSKHLDENNGTRGKILKCKAEDYFGLSDVLLCLEKSAEGRACIYRIAFGPEYFCTDRRRISHFRNYGR